MSITIAKKPELDLNGERWVEIAPGAQLLVGSMGSPLYLSHLAVLNRHAGAINSQYGVGTADFSIAKLPEYELENIDSLYFDLVATHLVKDWKGIDVEDAPGVPAKYSPALCTALFKQMDSAYFAVLKAATDIAKRVERQAADTAEKP